MTLAKSPTTLIREGSPTLPPQNTHTQNTFTFMTLDKSPTTLNCEGRPWPHTHTPKMHSNASIE